jgi:hypothetical protein
MTGTPLVTLLPESDTGEPPETPESPVEMHG